MEYLKVGQITKTVGLRGELRIFPTTSFTTRRFKNKGELFVLVDEGYAPLTIERKREHGKFYVIKFKELNTIEEAQIYVGKELLAPKDNTLLKKDEYFHSDLIDCLVYFNNSDLIGKVTRIEDYGPYSSLRVKKDKDEKDVLIPFVESYLVNVNILKKEIIIRYIKGLVE